MSLSNEEWQTLQDAWAILDKYESAWSDFAAKREMAGGRFWGSPSWEYIGDISDRGIVFHSISGYEDGYDTTNTEFTAEELLNMDDLLTRHTIMGTMLKEASDKEAEEKRKRTLRDQYEKLKTLLEGEGDA